MIEFCRFKINARNLLCMLPLFLLMSCNEEEYDLSNISDDLVVETALDAPIGTVSISLPDVFLHRGAGGNFSSKDSVFNLKDILSEKDIPLPIMAKSINVSASDTLHGVGFNNVFGDGNPIDSLENIVLKVNVENQLPFSVDLELRFLYTDTIFSSPTTYTIVQAEDESLRRSAYIESSEIDPSSKMFYSSSYSDVKFEYDSSENEKLRRVKDIVLLYGLQSSGGSLFYLSSDYLFKATLSAYVKAKLSLNKF